MGMLQYGSMDRRFFHTLGASPLDRTICASAGAAGLTVTLGSRMGTDMEAFAHSELIILWAVSYTHLDVYKRQSKTSRKAVKAENLRIAILLNECGPGN